MLGRDNVIISTLDMVEIIQQNLYNILFCLTIDMLQKLVIHLPLTCYFTCIL